MAVNVSGEYSLLSLAASSYVTSDGAHWAKFYKMPEAAYSSGRGVLIVARISK